VLFRSAYYLTCTDYKKDEQGNITEVYCTYDPETKGGWSDDGRKVKGTVHWVSVNHCKKVPVNIYDHLFLKENPEETEEGKDFTSNINTDSLTQTEVLAEPETLNLKPEEHIQFLRKGYFITDHKKSSPGKPVFNKTCGLKGIFEKKF